MARYHDPLIHCLHLRCKQMTYEVPGEEPAEESHVSSACDTTAYWCQCTQTARGPDERPVGRAECVLGRKCFESFATLA